MAFGEYEFLTFDAPTAEIAMKRIKIDFAMTLGLGRPSYEECDSDDFGSVSYWHLCW